MQLYRIAYHPGAEEDLIQIFDLIEAYAGKRIAHQKLDEIEAATYRLADYPKIGSIRHRLSDALRAIPAGDKAVICFRVEEEQRVVRILHISYAGADWQKTVKARL